MTDSEIGSLFDDIDAVDLDDFKTGDDVWQYDYEESGKSDFEMPSSDSDIGVVLIFGNTPSESVVTSVKVTNRVYITKLFRSKQANWSKMINLVEIYGKKPSTQIICQITESTLLTSCEPRYSQVFKDLMNAVSGTRHIVLIYYKNLSGEFKWHDNIRYYSAHYHVDENVVINILKDQISQLQQMNINIVPYRSRFEFNFSAQNFLDESESGLVLRLYVPNNRLFGDEMDHLLTLFQDYLNKVTGKAVTLQQNRTLHGVSYNFFSSDAGTIRQNWQQSLSDFNQLLTMCVTNPQDAIDELKNKGIADPVARDIINRYSRESRRVLVDIGYQRKKAFTEIEHRLMSELIDVASSELNEQIVGEIINASLPIANSLSPTPNSLSIPMLSKNGNMSLTYNIANAQIINTANGIIANVVNGDVSYNENDRELLQLIAEHATQIEGLELKGALDELKDDSAPKIERVTAWQKLYTFIQKHSGKMQEVLVSVIAKYLENMLTK